MGTLWLEGREENAGLAFGKWVSRSAARLYESVGGYSEDANAGQYEDAIIA